MVIIGPGGAVALDTAKVIQQRRSPIPELMDKLEAAVDYLETGRPFLVLA